MLKQVDLRQFFEERKDIKHQLLGQVSTPSHIADLMVEIALSVNPKKILDPCFGKGVFIESLIKKGYPKENIIGVEIDPYFYSNFMEMNPELHLENKDFFDFDTQVDCIIMNPPYVRQENLTMDMPKFLNKRYLTEKMKNLKVDLSARSNLYLYFFIKAWSILKINGSLIAIIPNTWAAADYGKKFKKFLLDNFLINKFISFKKDVFPNADVESCILHLTKKGINENFPNHKVEFVNLSTDSSKSIKTFLTEQHEDYSTLYYQKDLKVTSNWLTILKKEHIWNEDVLISLDSVADINRGIGTNSNSIFINEVSKYKDSYGEYFQPIICSPKDVIGYSTRTRLRDDYILLTDAEKWELPKELQEYLEKQELKILKAKRPKTLYEKLLKAPNSWYKLKKRQPSLILFGYIIRENKKFIFNDSKMIARDNFYEINVKQGIDPYLIFSILNSRITSYFLEDIGRSHGKGLLKIQKYELDSLRIINPKILSINDRVKLITFAKQLINENNINIIDEIDAVLLPYVSQNINVEKLQFLLNKKEKDRFAKKKV